MLSADVQSLCYEASHDALFAGDTGGHVHVFRRSPAQQRLDTLHSRRVAPGEAILSVWYDPPSDRLVLATADSHVAVTASPMKSA